MSWHAAWHWFGFWAPKVVEAVVVVLFVLAVSSQAAVSITVK